MGLSKVACFPSKKESEGCGEGNGNPLQNSCLENPRDGGAAVYRVTQSQTRLKWLKIYKRKNSNSFTTFVKHCYFIGWSPGNSLALFRHSLTHRNIHTLPHPNIYTHTVLAMYCICIKGTISRSLLLNLGEGNGNPLQYYCQENPMERGAW